MTAVEFLESQYKFNGQLFKSDFQQAKAMEKEQKIEFACKVVEVSADKYIQGKTTEQIAEELIKQQ